MEWRKGVDICGVLAGNRQLEVSVIEQPAPQHVRVSAKVIATERILDRDFPDARRAEMEFVPTITQMPACDRGQPVGLTCGPQ